MGVNIITDYSIAMLSHKVVFMINFVLFRGILVLAGMCCIHDINHDYLNIQ